MRKNTFIELDITKNIENGIKFYAKQFDDLKLKVKVFDGVKEVDVQDQEIVVFIVKEDKTVVEQKEDIIVEDNTIIVDLSKQATTALGKCSMEILLKDEEGVSSTSTVQYMVGEKLSTTIVEIIQSTDDIEVLNMIEEFIQNSNVDILEIKEAIKALEDGVNEAQNSINADFESIIAKIKELETSTISSISSNADEVKERAIGEIERVSNETIEKIEVAKDEVVTSANKAIEKANEAVEKAGETLEAVNTVKEEIENINDTVAEAIGTIESTKDEAIDEIASSVVVIEESKEDAINLITSTKNSAISSIANEKIASVNTINGLKENAINGIEVSRQGAVSSIEEAKQGAVDKVKGSGAIVVGDIKAEIAIEKNKIIEEAKSELNIYASTTTEEALESIEDTKAVAMQNIVETKTSAIQDVNNSKDTVLESVKASLNDEKNKIVAEASEGLNTVKETAVNEINSAKDGAVEEVKAGVDTVKADAIKEINTTKENVLQSFGSELEVKKGAAIESFDADLSSKKDSAIASAKVELDNAKAVTVKAIEETKSDAMSKLQEQGNGIANDLTTLKGKAIEEINTVKGNNIEEITTKLNEVKSELDALVLVKDEVLSANSTGETTLANLLDAIRRAEEVTAEVEAYIESKSGNHDEIYAEIEVVKAMIEAIDLTKYYTKEEVDNLVSGGFNGSIGVSTKFASMPMEIFDNAPEAPEIAGSEYIGKMLYSELDNYSKTEYRVVYLYNNPAKNYYPYLYLDNSGSEEYIKNVNIGSAYGTYKAYKTANGASFSDLTSMPSILYNERKQFVIYHSDVPIYSDLNKTDIFRDASGANEYISNLDNANKTGKYYVKLSRSEYDSIQNMPAIKLTKDLETVLHCCDKDGKILQEMTIEGVTYTRVVGENWTGMDTSNIVKKDVIATIEGSVATAYSEVDDIFASCPVPNQHQDIVGQIDFKVEDNKYCRMYTYKKTGNEMFYKTDSSSTTIYIGSTANRYYFVRYIYADGTWAQDTSTNSYVSCKKAQFELYRNTLPICKGTSSTAFDKNVIVEDVKSSDEKVLTDFNDVTSFGVYDIDIKADTVASNSPVEGELSGALECIVVKDKIVQRLTTIDCSVYIRVYDGSTWTEWRAI